MFVYGFFNFNRLQANFCHSFQVSTIFVIDSFVRLLSMFPVSTDFGVCLQVELDRLLPLFYSYPNLHLIMTSLTMLTDFGACPWSEVKIYICTLISSGPLNSRISSKHFRALTDLGLCPLLRVLIEMMKGKGFSRGWMGRIGIIEESRISFKKKSPEKTLRLHGID